MDEVRAVPWNGYTVASLFAGAGGSSLGYRLAGFRVLYANEFIREAADVYDANRAPYTRVDRRDIRTVTPDEIRAELVAAYAEMMPAGGSRVPFGELDVLDGSPPCRSFSTAGRRAKVWGKVKQYSGDVSQRDDDLFMEYARILRGLRPRVFVAENVTGLIKGVSKGYFKEIVRALSDAGYVVAVRVLDASKLGVPQARQRVFIVGVRADIAELGVAPAFPTPLPYAYSVRDAIGELLATGERPVIGTRRPNDRRTSPSLDAPSHTVTAGHNAYFVEGATGFDGHAGRSVDEPMGSVTAKRAVRIGLGRGKSRSLDEPAPTVLQHGNLYTRSELSLIREQNRMEHGAPLSPSVGREYDKLSQGDVSRKYVSLVRTGMARPSHTITAIGGTDAAGVAHPTERRKFTIAELRRVCAFPDDFILSGSYAQQWERLGRAVPPIMMFHLAETIRDRILRLVDGRTETD